MGKFDDVRLHLRGRSYRWLVTGAAGFFGSRAPACSMTACGSNSQEEDSRDAFFARFDEADLVSPYRDKTKDGHESRFFKFVKRPR